MAENPKRIQLVGHGHHEEARASAALSPGHLVALGSDGKVAKHADAAGPHERMFALEDALQGRGIDVDYAADELVQLDIAQPGNVVYAFLAVGESADIGDYLTSNGDGTLKVASGSDIPVGVALEALDLGDSSNEVDTRIRVRVV